MDASGKVPDGHHGWLQELEGRRGINELRLDAFVADGHLPLLGVLLHVVVHSISVSRNGLRSEGMEYRANA